MEVYVRSYALCKQVLLHVSCSIALHHKLSNLFLKEHYELLLCLCSFQLLHRKNSSLVVKSASRIDPLFELRQDMMFPNFKRSTTDRMLLKVFTALVLLFCSQITHAAFLSGINSGRTTGLSSCQGGIMQHQSQSKFMGRGMRLVSTTSNSRSSQGKGSNSRRTELAMFLGSDGGVLGVGAPEIVSRKKKHGDIFFQIMLTVFD